ncbi:MAG: hypothetical protein RLZZ239_993 [Pseudomonadota bacterium]
MTDLSKRSIVKMVALTAVAWQERRSAQGRSPSGCACKG